jgi:hypothetical protein
VVHSTCRVSFNCLSGSGRYSLLGRSWSRSMKGKNSFVGLLILQCFATDQDNLRQIGPLVSISRHSLPSNFSMSRDEVRTHNGSTKDQTLYSPYNLGITTFSTFRALYLIFFIHIVFCTDRLSGSGVRHCLRELHKVTSMKRVRSRRSARRHLAGASLY